MADVVAVTNPITGEVSDELVPCLSAVGVYEEHIRALNACDWTGLVAQFPDHGEIHLRGGEVVRGRQAIGEFFAAAVRRRAEGGLGGLTFVEHSRLEVGDTLVVRWFADADFLAEPHVGSDAYVTDGACMVAMVTTFDDGALVFAD